MDDSNSIKFSVLYLALSGLFFALSGRGYVSFIFGAPDSEILRLQIEVH